MSSKMKQETNNTYQERILKVLIHIQNHLDNDLSLAELAKVAMFSPYHFHRIFSGMVGESVAEHIRRLRLERAALRLKGSQMPITQIAFEAGLETHEGFTRAFRAMFNLSPTEFRKLHQALSYSQAPSGVHFMQEGNLESFDPLIMDRNTMDVEIKKVDPIRVAFMRHVGPYQEVGSTWEKLCAWAGPKGLFRPDTVFYGLSYDDPNVTPPDKIRYDACITAPDNIQAEGDVGVQTIGDGDYAVCTHNGPYEKLTETYGKLCGQWLPGSGREIRSAPSIEHYKNSPQDTPPEDLVTDIYMPLE